MHLIEQQQQVRKRTHARALALSLSLCRTLVYLLACAVRVCVRRAVVRRTTAAAASVQREEVIISAAILKAHAWRLFPWKSSPCLFICHSWRKEVGQ